MDLGCPYDSLVATEGPRWSVQTIEGCGKKVKYRWFGKSYWKVVGEVEMGGVGADGTKGFATM